MTKINYNLQLFVHSTSHDTFDLTSPNPRPEPTTQHLRGFEPLRCDFPWGIFFFNTCIYILSTRVHMYNKDTCKRTR